MADERVILLKAMPGFQGCPDETVDELAGNCVLRRFKAGTVIVRPESRPGGLYLLAAGAVLLEEGTGRKAIEVGRVCPGEVLGHLGTTSLAGDGVVARAEVDVVALELPQWRSRQLADDVDGERAGPLRRAIIISMVRSVRRREQRVARYMVDLGAASAPGDEVYAPEELETGTLSLHNNGSSNDY